MWNETCTDVKTRVRATQCAAEPVDGFYSCSAVVHGATAFAEYKVAVAGVNEAGTSLSHSQPRALRRTILGWVTVRVRADPNPNPHPNPNPNSNPNPNPN